jgi:predicted DNA-binding protein (MmcQ/YjbR family)
MDLADFREYCLAKPDGIEGTPFGETVLVFKVGGKMFALLALDEVPTTANLKCDPDLALDLRDQYEQVRPGYHMNKKHWNTVEIDTGIHDAEVRKMIDHSYDLVVKSLPKSDRRLPPETMPVRLGPAATTKRAARRHRSPSAKRRARR